MKKFLKRLFIVVLCVAIGYCGFRYGPYLYARLFGDGNVRWISEKFSETLKEKNELIVSEAEITGQETVSQDAWLLGTVQKVEMPYTFQLSYTVDLSLAKVEAQGTVVRVRVPSPKATYCKLIVDDTKMKKSDFFYPLTPERYADIKNEVETKLYNEYSGNQENLDKAWSATVKNLESLFKAVVASSSQDVQCSVEVTRDDTLTAAPSASPKTVAPTATTQTT